MYAVPLGNCNKKGNERPIAEICWVNGVGVRVLDGWTLVIIVELMVLLARCVVSNSPVAEGWMRGLKVGYGPWELERGSS